VDRPRSRTTRADVGFAEYTVLDFVGQAYAATHRRGQAALIERILELEKPAYVTSETVVFADTSASSGKA
jgi:hypothetical protein